MDREKFEDMMREIVKYNDYYDDDFFSPGIGPKNDVNFVYHHDSKSQKVIKVYNVHKVDEYKQLMLDLYPRKAVFDNPNKMRFQSEHKTFNKLTNLISTGNVITNTQTSFFIRAKKEEREFDIKSFPGSNDAPKQIKKRIEDDNRTESVILYKFHIKGKPLCWVLTDKNYKFIDCELAYNKPSYREGSVLMEVMRFIVNKNGE